MAPMIDGDDFAAMPRIERLVRTMVRTPVYENLKSLSRLALGWGGTS